VLIVAPALVALAVEAATTLPEPPPEAPPPAPHRHGVVAEGSLGALAFGGQFRHVAPPAIWLHMQLGYEATKWITLFGEGELAFTDTSVAEDEANARAFPMFGFGGGLRATWTATERVALYVQGSIDAMKADVPRNALANLGYRNAESLAAAFGARVGVEWLQVDPHMGLGLAVGVRDATGFAKTVGSSDTGLMADAGLVIKYTF
jgi:hypothetical protein